MCGSEKRTASAFDTDGGPKPRDFFNFCAAHSPVRLDIETKFLISNYRQPALALATRHVAKCEDIFHVAKDL